MSILVDENGNLLTKNGNLLNLKNSSGSEGTPTLECSFKNLGALTSYEDLNNVLDVGYYIFKMFSDSGETTHFYILEIEDTQFYTLQTIVCLGLDNPGFVKRTYWKALGTWETSSVKMLLESGIVDNLESTETNKALSSNQGRILKEFIDNLQDVSGVIINLGTIIELPNTEINKTLNAVKTKGLYYFDNFGVPNLMFVTDPFMNTIHQYLIHGNPDGGMWLFLRESLNGGSSWTVKQQTLLSDLSIVDSLESNDSAKPLSANQGRILNEKITNIEEEISKGSNTSSIINLGTISSYDDLNLVTTDGFYIYKAAFGQTNPDMCLMEVYHQQQYAIQVIYLFNHAFAKLVTRQQTLVNYEIVWGDVIEHSLLKSTDVINNLSTASSTMPLSALQGKLLNEKISKYIHCISIVHTVTTTPLSIFMNFENSTSTIISNYSELVTAIYNAGFVSASKFLQVNGKLIVVENSKEYNVVGIYSDGSTLRFVYLVGTNCTARIVEESAVISDNVI